MAAVIETGAKVTAITRQGADKVQAGDGNHTIRTSGGNDQVIAGDGDNRIPLTVRSGWGSSLRWNREFPSTSSQS